MPIDRNTVRHIAALARLQVEEAEEERYVRELQAILSYVEELQELNVDGVEPTSTVVAGSPSPLRPDEERPCDVREEALSEAPDRDGDYFRVPRVV
ncbi:MAG TPA: Asp-tRNA(Asn)/Glu-tRNA(Gln) amidotransferase subunit GatC [Candidatus Eisenbacteria bacterium]|nr:Asp-tRNA(Asn)/Glu-tRNA(Gln) amidotransferase subunit GatC [Candidatus Eisenbacteria bacterium]